MRERPLPPGWRPSCCTTSIPSPSVPLRPRLRRHPRSSSRHPTSIVSTAHTIPARRHPSPRWPSTTKSRRRSRCVPHKQRPRRRRLHRHPPSSCRVSARASRRPWCQNGTWEGLPALGAVVSSDCVCEPNRLTTSSETPTVALRRAHDLRSLCQGRFRLAL